jgi:hypothetical protein
MEYPGRVIQVGEGDAALVRSLAARLAERGYPSQSPPGVFDDGFAALVKLFQSQHGDVFGRALRSDGQVGPLTWSALFDEPAPGEPLSLAAAALAKAVSQVGVMEVPPGSNKGPQVEAYLKSVGAAAGSFWCMAFVHWCFDRAAEASGVANAFPKTAGCLDAWNQVKASTPKRAIPAADVRANPSLLKPGFVFILDHGGGHGHTGFVAGHAGGAIQSVEGNSNNTGSANGVGVFALNRRSVMESDLKGFLDFT